MIQLPTDAMGIISYSLLFRASRNDCLTCSGEKEIDSAILAQTSINSSADTSSARSDVWVIPKPLIVIVILSSMSIICKIQTIVSRIYELNLCVIKKYLILKINI